MVIFKKIKLIFLIFILMSCDASLDFLKEKLNDAKDRGGIGIYDPVKPPNKPIVGDEEIDWDFKDVFSNFKITSSGDQIRLTVKAKLAQVTSDRISFEIRRKDSSGNELIISDRFKPEYYIPYIEYLDESITQNETYQYKIQTYIDNRVYGDAIVSSNININTRMYFFASSGNDSNNGLSTSSPFKSLNKIKSLNLKPGDMLRFKSGDQFSQGEFTWDQLGSGSESRPITLTSYGGDTRPIIKSNGGRVLYLKNDSHVHFDHLEFKGASKWQIEVYANKSDMQDIRFRRIKCDGMNSSAKSACLVFQVDGRKVLGPTSSQKYHITDVEVSDSEFINAGGRSGNSDAVRFWSVKARGHVHHNHFKGNAGEAVDVAGGKDHIVEYNIMDCDHLNDAGGSKAHGQYYPLENMLYRFNLIVNCKTFALSLQDSKNGKVYHNTTNNHSFGYNNFSIHGKNRPQDIQNNLVVNNIFIGSKPSRAPIRLSIRDRKTDSSGFFSDEVIDHLGINWRNKNKLNMHHNIIYSHDKFFIWYDYRSNNNDVLYTYPEMGGALVHVGVEKKDLATRWNQYHQSSIQEMPDFVDMTHNDYRLNEGSVGFKNAFEIDGENYLRDLGNEPVNYSKGANRGAYN